MKKILVIDDDPNMRRLLSRTLVALGHEIKVAENGEEGVACCLEWSPDAVLTDIYMPDQDGLETIKKIRAHISGDRIIAMSGGGSIGHMDVLRCARLMGAKYVLTKPFDLNDLKSYLKEMFEDPETHTPD